MEKRLILAIMLMIAMVFLANRIFPSRPRPPVTAADSLPPAGVAEREVPESVIPPPALPPPQPAAAERIAAADSAPPLEGDTVVVESPLYRYAISSAGGRLVRAWLTSYKSFAPGDSGMLQLLRHDAPLLSLALSLGTDTVRMDRWVFAADRHRVDVRDDVEELTPRAERDALEVVLWYRFWPDDYRLQVRGRVSGLPVTGAVLAVGLGSGLRSVEADSAEDYRNFAVVTKGERTRSLRFSKVRPGTVDTLSGPFEWVATKSKYFVAALLAIQRGAVEFGGVLAQGGSRSGKLATHLDAVATLPVTQQGTFGYDVYLGPQEAGRLRAVGHDLQDVNPYGWAFLRPMIKPIAAGVVFVLIWTKEQLHVAYGWVLILFGLAIRVLLWPLNQKQMESAARMQAVQPHMEEIKQRYKDDRAKQQEQVMKLYREHKVNPFGGCVPALIPLPILFALFFVFQNTIEFRGVPFLWLPDLSRADPLYITPLVMGLSMFALMRIGQIGVPKNPQTRMLAYVMPVMITAILLRFASGLNLYYAAMNIFSLPQQWLIARRRLARPSAAPKKP